jgi:N-acyl-D-amino-acid deacylase
MAADIAVLEPDTIIDRATYEEPAVLSVGVRFVLVNGVVALEDGVATGARSGRALFRTANMPSRAPSDGLRALRANGPAAGRRVAIDVTERAGGREATGSISIQGLDPIAKIGNLQVADGWAALSATAGAKSVIVIVDLRDPHNAGSATVAVNVDGYPWLRGTLPSTAVVIK